MKNTDIHKSLIESIVRNTLKYIHISPEREIRNLIDLGVYFANGHFQKLFLGTIQTMLQNPNSAYYTLVKKTIKKVDTQRLLTFGVNLGYNSYTKGVKKIRQYESECHFNIPWILNFVINTNIVKKDPLLYDRLIQQGNALGIYTYAINVTDDPNFAIDLIAHYSDCVFIFFIKGTQITDQIIESILPYKNIMLAIKGDDAIDSICQNLKKNGLLYAIYRYYSATDKEAILNNQWINALLKADPLFIFLIPESHCPLIIQQKIYEYILTTRFSQAYPVILFDYKYDLLMIDKIISGDECIAGFDQNGFLFTYGGLNNDPSFNFYHHSLDTILRKASPKI